MIAKPRSLPSREDLGGAVDGRAELRSRKVPIDESEDLRVPDRGHGARISVTELNQSLDLFDPTRGERALGALCDPKGKLFLGPADAQQLGAKSRCSKPMLGLPGGEGASADLEDLERAADANEVVRRKRASRDAGSTRGELGVQRGPAFDLRALGVSSREWPCRPAELSRDRRGAREPRGTSLRRRSGACLAARTSAMVSSARAAKLAASIGSSGSTTSMR